ncbi:TetR/AcrR family transcriptional regulator [Rhabdaerophilum sp. SD176]|uniref:TetR/AcrR family transcriptional regulator n=1 Tax=Rhabdaerophilum sp. SD176 TaxID=2983548 RepID=UPI0024DFED80|nr:TetR/AcrR family transcriptional regulator [Rhabdaerophilum sp. SD176]
MKAPQDPGNPSESGYSGHARDRILRAAAAAFSQRGFHGVTVRDLAQQARVNLAAVNYHFRSKEELYSAVIDSALQSWLAETVVLDDLPGTVTLPDVIRLLVSALVAPVIEREEAPLLPRLIAWDLLQGARQTRIGASPAIAARIRARLARHMPESMDPMMLDLIADWLVSQCLLLTPAFRSPLTGTLQDYAALQGLAEQISVLALNGLSGLAKSQN